MRIPCCILYCLCSVSRPLSIYLPAAGNSAPLLLLLHVLLLLYEVTAIGSLLIMEDLPASLVPLVGSQPHRHTRLSKGSRAFPSLVYPWYFTHFPRWSESKPRLHISLLISFFSPHLLYHQFPDSPFFLPACPLFRLSASCVVTSADFYSTLLQVIKL